MLNCYVLTLNVCNNRDDTCVFLCTKTGVFITTMNRIKSKRKRMKKKMKKEKKNVEL